MVFLKDKPQKNKSQASEKLPHVMHVLQNAGPSASNSYAQSLRQRLAQAVGFTAVLGFVLADLFSQGLDDLNFIDWQLITLFLPFLLLPLALTFPYRIGAPRIRQYILIGMFVSSVSIASYMGINRHHSTWFNQQTLTLATIYIYFLSGLPLLRALFCGLAAWLAFTVSESAGSSIIKVLSSNPYLLIANFVGALGLFYLEWHSRHRHELEMVLRSDAMRDDLTGTLNRRAIYQHLLTVWRQAFREKTGLCVLRVDIDSFKALNRRFGHKLGDSALRHISALLEAEIRQPLDAVGRSGTNEFLVVLYDYEPLSFKEMMKKLPMLVTKFNLGDSMDIEPLTVSGGAVIAQPASNTDEEWEQFIECMDENLARARLNGHNKIVVSDFEPSQESDTERWNMKTMEIVAAPPM